jgi:hypothetical protein
VKQDSAVLLLFLKTQVPCYLLSEAQFFSQKNFLELKTWCYGHELFSNTLAFRVKPLASEIKPFVSDTKPLVSDTKPLVSDAKPLVSDTKPLASGAKPFDPAFRSPILFPKPVDAGAGMDDANVEAVGVGVGVGLGGVRILSCGRVLEIWTGVCSIGKHISRT